MQPYDATFFGNVRDGAINSARALVPVVRELVNPATVVDVGCGDGTWLSVFIEHGVTSVLGLDGDYVDRASLRIPAERFRAADLRRPLALDVRFDLVVSLEVAEHLPPECAQPFVHQLTRLGRVVMFSAAVPFQGGRNHLNEQWPEYWIERFATEGFVAVDCLRPRVWNLETIEWWYAQNAFVFVENSALAALPALQREAERAAGLPARVVHPRAYLACVENHRRYKQAGHWMHAIAGRLEALVPEGDWFILVDDLQLEPWTVPRGRRARPFLERDGQYWGPPPDDATALVELERMRHDGAALLVVAWPAFWWLEFYREFSRHLRAHFPCVWEDEHVVIFDLRSRT